MIRAVVWKELREQGVVAAMLAVLGSALLVAAAMLADPPSPTASPTDILAVLGAGRLLTLMLVVTAGMVCGGALFAAEKEAGTMAFLDALPTARWALWRAKLVAGLVLALAEVSLLLVAATALDLTDGPFLRRLIVYALLAFAWGALGSTLARTTLGSVGVAIPAASLASFAFLLPIYILFAAPGGSVPRPIGWALFEVLMVVTPLALSAWRFTAPDRARTVDATAASASAKSEPGRARAGLGFRALVWLALRQLRLTGPVLSAFAVVSGVALLLPEMRPFFVWPLLALTAGVIAGVTAFGDEQAHRSAVFWAEHRLPVGRAWLVKIAVHLGLLAWLLFLLALPCAIRSQFQPTGRGGFGQSALAGLFHTRVFDDLGSQGWKYLLVPAAYGFACGHLCGLLFRKLVVACGVAVMIGGVGAALWGPSLVAGGVKHWQVWLPAAAILLTGRLLIRAWACDRVGAHGPLVRLAGGAAVTLLAFVVGLGYRVVQVPDEPGGADDVEFAASLPSYDENVAGREFRAAAERFARVAVTAAQDAGRTPEGRRRPRLDERVESVARFGWPKDDPELAAWLDRVFTDPDDQPWPAAAALAATRPVGVYEPPQLVSTTATTAAALDNARKMAVAILARGLQQQAGADPAAVALLSHGLGAQAAGDPLGAVLMARVMRHLAVGDPEAFLPAFRTVVALARTVRRGSGLLALTAGIEMERTALHAVDRWLERLGEHESPLEAARIASEADDLAPFDPHPHVLADRYVIRGMQQAPNQWLTTVLTVPGTSPDRSAPEADLIAVGWSVPWEKERTRRLVGLAPEGRRPEMYALVNGRPGASLLMRNRTAADLTENDAQLRVARRAVILKAAVRAFQAERGRPPSALPELIAGGYLARLPEDPYSAGKPFGYRVSAGEELRGPARAPAAGRPAEDAYVVPVSRGQAVFWSVGVDRIDQGGRVPPGGPHAADIVFLGPAPAPPH